MRTLAVLLAVAACALAGRLEHTYLPPAGAALSGGSGLAAPFVSQQGYQQNYQGYQQGSVQTYSQQSQQSQQRPVAIIKQLNQNQGDGTYSFSYETENGIQAQEQGQGAASAQGSFSYTGPDNVRYSVQYTADENGFLAYGDHLPTPPPVPAEIQRAIEQNLADEARGVSDDGQYRPEHEANGNAHQGYPAPSRGSSGYRY